MAQAEQVTPIAQSWRIYLDGRIAKIFLLGLIQGFPWVLIGAHRLVKQEEKEEKEEEKEEN